MRAHIKDFLSQSPRNKLVLVPRHDAHLLSVDVGHALAAVLAPHLSSPQLPQLAEEALRALIVGARHDDPVIGPYVALHNWGILFEPALGLNLPALLGQYDKNQTLILENCGVVAGDQFKLAAADTPYGFPIKALCPYILP